jgi:hypothetical protein
VAPAANADAKTASARDWKRGGGAENRAKTEGVRARRLLARARFRRKPWRLREQKAARAQRQVKAHGRSNAKAKA